MTTTAFEFLPFDHIAGKQVDLLIHRRMAADDIRGFVPAYRYHIVLAGTHQIVGEIDLRIEQGYHEKLYYGGHIGYAVEKPYRGHHYAADACQLVSRVALAHGMHTLLITCDPSNLASRKTCERVGAVLHTITDLPMHHDLYQEGKRQVCIYVWKLDQNAPDNPPCLK